MRSNHTRRAMTLGEVLVVLGVIFCLGLLFMFGYAAMRNRGDGHNRTYCSATLAGIGKALYVYAAANKDMWPMPPHLSADADEVGRVRYAPGKIGSNRGSAADPDQGKTTENDDQMSTTRVFWTLVREGTCSPRSFICPSAKSEAGDEENPAKFWDFRNYNEVSYGYQVPFGKHGKPQANLDQDMAIVADKGPYGAALELGKTNPGTPKLPEKSSAEKWRKFNSPNHGGYGTGEGQNVMYPDGRADWSPTPLAGCKKDNIYTRWSRADADKDPTEASRVQGTPPTGIETPWSDTDSLIYP